MAKVLVFEGHKSKWDRGVSYRCNTRVVRQHQSTDTVAHRDIRTPLRQRNLYTCWAPWDKRRQSSLPDPQQTLVHICRVDFALDHVQDGDVAALLARHS